MTLRTCALAFTLFSILSSAHAADFTPCSDAATDPALAGSRCAIEIVAANPSGPAGARGEVALFVRMLPALGTRRGSVWLVAGGPGESGAAFYGLLPNLRDTFPGFDLVIPDHRGTGASTRMCAPEEAVASPGGTSLAGAEWGSCFASLNANPATTRQFSQTNAAYDLQTLLARAPHAGKTFVYGVSYGTQLVLRTVALGTPGIDGIILDSLVPLQDDASADLSRRSLLVDAVGRRILAGCDASPRCSRAMGEPTEQLYRKLLARAATEPQLFDTVPGKNPKRFFGSLLDMPDAAVQIPYLIKELDTGGATRMQAVIASVQQEMAGFGTFAQSAPSLPLVILISGSENNLQPGRTAPQVASEEAGLLFASPLPGYLVDPPFPLYAHDAWFARLPAQLPPTLVIHGTQDAKTPYEAALRHIAALRRAGKVKLFTATGGAHFLLWSDKSCARAEVRSFVLGAAATTQCVSVNFSH
ncbi:alpha/beta fold hydrolase [Massilia sp. S19_KUP03_FR1]|uniref:alpha/beta fold hydrolase n=1 Tax=Massilia sp. S19_KUP03_FR1 TaxID=3025503 RepID=UPI002FCD04A6